MCVCVCVCVCVVWGGGGGGGTHGKEEPWKDELAYLRNDPLGPKSHNPPRFPPAILCFIITVRQHFSYWWHFTIWSTDLLVNFMCFSYIYNRFWSKWYFHPTWASTIHNSSTIINVVVVYDCFPSLCIPHYDVDSSSGVIKWVC